MQSALLSVRDTLPFLLGWSSSREPLRIQCWSFLQPLQFSLGLLMSCNTQLWPHRGSPQPVHPESQGLYLQNMPDHALSSQNHHHLQLSPHQEQPSALHPQHQVWALRTKIRRATV
jgi:hypothetical protein